VNAIFADAVYWIAWTNPEDQWHRTAIVVRNEHPKAELVTTEDVLVEVLTYFGGYGPDVRQTASRVVRFTHSAAHPAQHRRAAGGGDGRTDPLFGMDVRSRNCIGAVTGIAEQRMANERIGTMAHRLSTVKNADRVYVLDDGRVIEEGSYHELRAREDGEFREMVEMQSL
jgi:hypothetical protein